MKRGFQSAARKLSFLLRKRFWRWAGIVAAAVVLLQLLFPYDRAFFLARVDGQSVALNSREQIQSQLQARYASAEVVTSNPQTKTSFKEAGIVVDSEMTADEVTKYPVWQRLLPFSSVYKLFSRDHASRVNYRALSLQQWASQVNTACNVAPKDAGVVVKDGKLEVVPSASGATCDEKTIMSRLKSTTLAARMHVETGRKVAQPERSDAEVQAQLGKIEKVLSQGVTVQVLGSTTRASSDEIVSWLQFKDGVHHEIVLDVDPAKVESFIARVQRPVYQAPGVTTIYQTDGQETSRSTGGVGQGIDATDLVAQLKKQFQTLTPTAIAAKVVALPPRQTFVRTYTNSPQGLQALLNTLVTEKGDMAIAVTELSGQGRSLSANGSKQYHPASTYKLFIAYSVMKRIESSQLKWADNINGTTVDECLTRMIVNSDNACAEAFAEKFSWKAVQSELRAIGATSTDLNRSEPVGTVTDQVLFLQKLYRDQLMKPEHKDKLLALMKRQAYRAGIPAGVSVEVADKVGFLSGLLHDSGLVYGPRGVYALSIYSSGGSWGKIADAARQIQNLLNS